MCRSRWPISSTSRRFRCAQALAALPGLPLPPSPPRTACQQATSTATADRRAGDGARGAGRACGVHTRGPAKRRERRGSFGGAPRSWPSLRCERDARRLCLCSPRRADCTVANWRHGVPCASRSRSRAYAARTRASGCWAPWRRACDRGVMSSGARCAVGERCCERKGRHGQYEGDVLGFPRSFEVRKNGWHAKPRRNRNGGAGSPIAEHCIHFMLARIFVDNRFCPQSLERRRCSRRTKPSART